MSCVGVGVGRYSSGCLGCRGAGLVARRQEIWPCVDMQVPKSTHKWVSRSVGMSLMGHYWV